MGLGAGGKMKQKIYPDRFGVDTWDVGSRTDICVHLVNSDQYTFVTGHPVPATPIDAESYTAAGLPWLTYTTTTAVMSTRPIV